jgi:transposase
MKGFVVLPRRWVVERTFSGSDETVVSPRTSRNPGYLRYPGLHPARYQVACQGVGRRSAKGWTPALRGYARERRGCAESGRPNYRDRDNLILGVTTS